MYCTDADCEKKKKGYCKIPTEPVNEQDVPYSMDFRCTCKGCQWDEITPEFKVCEFVGDSYNTDGDCLALK